jgi:hypothetical protein
MRPAPCEMHAHEVHAHEMYESEIFDLSLSIPRRTQGQRSVGLSVKIGPPHAPGQDDAALCSRDFVVPE